MALSAMINSVLRWSSVSQPTSGVTAAVVHPNSRFASTRSANSESPTYMTVGDVSGE